RASPAVSGISSSPFSALMVGGGLYVLGGAKICPQAVGPLFTRPAAGVPAGRRRRGRGGAHGAGSDGEKSMGEHGQRDVPVPGLVEPDLVVVQAGLVLGLGEAVLDVPPGPGHGDELRQRDRARRVAPEDSAISNSARSPPAPAAARSAPHAYTSTPA